MMAGLMLLPSCTVGGQNVEQMTDQQFNQVVQNAENAVVVGAIILKKEIKPDTRAALVTVATQMSQAIEGGSVSIPNSVDGLMVQFAEQLTKAGVDEQEVALISACVRLADSALGGVQFGVGASERAKTTALAILRAVKVGLK